MGGDLYAASRLRGELPLSRTARAQSRHILFIVKAGLVPATHVSQCRRRFREDDNLEGVGFCLSRVSRRTGLMWVPGTRPGMTELVVCGTRRLSPLTGRQERATFPLCLRLDRRGARCRMIDRRRRAMAMLGAAHEQPGAIGTLDLSLGPQIEVHPGMTERAATAVASDHRCVHIDGLEGLHFHFPEVHGLLAAASARPPATLRGPRSTRFG